MTSAIQDQAPAALSVAEQIAEYRARANLHRMLAGAFLEEPSQAYLAGLRSDEAGQTLQAFGVVFDDDFTKAPLPELQETLACEFAALFLVSGGCPAVESLRMTGRFQQQPYFETRDFYARCGFELASARHPVFYDQMGVELSFMAALLERAADALEQSNEVGHAQHLKDLKRFWVQHTGRWVRGYSTLLQQATAHSFFREMAKLLAAYADWELSLLGVKVDDVDQGRLKVPQAEIEYEFDPDEPVCNACEKDKSDTTELDALLQTVDISLIEKRLQQKKVV
ncbi:molecular chaperone [Ferrigenium sp. UT5]|uniref:TorD/DmsD family molecular chaperone n=1 Tax=Ferrigenium sp. UT5 TaxID=3242105 RepID=UPI00354FFC7B